LKATRSLLPEPWLYLANRSLAPLVPLPLMYALAQPIGDACHALLSRHRENVKRNYAAITGLDPSDPVIERMAAECFRHFSRYVAEFMHVQGWDTQEVLDHVDITGAEHFAEAQAMGKGVIFVSAHMGSTEIAATLAVLHGFKITAVSEEMRPRFAMDWAVASRRDMGITLLPVQKAGIRLLRALRKGEMVAMVVDAGPGLPDSIPVTFFGRQTLFPAGPARLARLSGAPIVFGLALRAGKGRFRAHICPPLVPDRLTAGEADTQRLTQEIAAIFEGFVREAPSQWYAFREMWPVEGSTNRR